MMSSKRMSSSVSEAMFKLIMIGDSGTGKSCLLARYTKDEFEEEYKVTIGVEFGSKKLDIDENYKIRLQIWDTAGQQTFRSIVKSFYRNANAVILVYNIINKDTFESLNNWILEARESSPKNAIFVLVGTHLDLEEKREVSKEAAETFMKKQDIAVFFQTSSKTAMNVSKAFDEVGKQLFMNQLEKRMGSASIVQPTKTEVMTPAEAPPRKFGCC